MNSSDDQLNLIVSPELCSHEYIKEFDEIDRINKLNAKIRNYESYKRYIKTERGIALKKLRYARFYKKKFGVPIECQYCKYSVKKLSDHMKSKKHLDNVNLYNLEQDKINTTNQLTDAIVNIQNLEIKISEISLEKTKIELDLDKLIIKPLELPIKKSKYGNY